MFETTGSRQLPSRTAAWLAGGWVALTLPMLGLGYGSDVDAWLVAARAFEMWSTGVYARSRSTGFPLFELTTTPLVVFGGWIASNAFVLTTGFLTFLAFRRLASAGALRFPAITIASFMFLPVFVKNATSTMDYVPALMLLVAAYAALHERRFLTSTVLIGIAAGFRPTSGLFVLPAAAAVLVAMRQPRTVLAMLAIAAGVGALVFLPSLRLGGFGLAEVTSPLNGLLNGMRMFGIVQTPLVAAIVGLSLWRVRDRLTQSDERAFVVFHVVNAIVWLGLFAMLPGEPEYLMPILPSVLFAVDRYASRRLAVATLVVLLSFHVLSIEVQGSRGGTRRRALIVANGFSVRDIDDRRFKMWLRAATNDWQGSGEKMLYMEQTMPPTVGVADWHWNPALNVYERDRLPRAVSEIITDASLLKALHAAGYRIVTWSAHAWEFDDEQARALVEFVDEPGTVLGVRRRGRPFSPAVPIP